LNRLLPEVKKAPPAVQFYAVKCAKKLGLTFNKKTRLYEKPQQPVAVTR
jgi:hypothetical protein